jgi:hypothetical protein
MPTLVLKAFGHVTIACIFSNNKNIKIEISKQ